MTNIAVAFQEERRARNLTLRQAAEIFSVSHTAVNKWERGLSEPTADKLIRLKRHKRQWVVELAKRCLGYKEDRFERGCKP